MSAVKRAILLLPLLLATRLDAAITRADLHAWLEEALAAAQRVPAEQRRAVAYSLDVTAGSQEERTRAILMKIALRPSSPAWWDMALTFTRDERRVPLEFLDAAYRERAEVGTAEGRMWQQGLAEMLFGTGKFDEALRLQRAVMAQGGSESYGLILLAMMEKVAGNGEAFARLQADPPPSAQTGVTPANYFRAVVNSVSQRMLLPTGTRPVAIQEMLTGGLRWEEKLHALHILAGSDPNAADMQLTSVINASDAPAWAKDDAMYTLATLANGGNVAGIRAVNLIDCWLSRRGVEMTRADAETWVQLAALEPPAAQEEWISGSTACYRHHDPDDASVSEKCLFATANLRVLAAVRARDFAALQHAVEWLGALVLARGGDGLNQLGFALGRLANIAPTPEARDQIFRYAATLKVQQALLAVDGEQVQAAVRSQTERDVRSPWSTPSPAVPVPRCP